MLHQQGQGYHDGAPRQVVLLEDITLVIDVALIAAFCVAVQLLRRRAITVATFAHALSVPFLVVVLGHYIERHLLGVDRVGDLVRRRPGRGSFADWSSAGLLSAAVVAALVARCWNCRGVGVDCVVGDAAPIHYRCKLMRLRFFGPVFAATMAFVYACISARLNALLGGSVLHPEEGGYALAVLASPTLVSALFVSGSVSVWMYSVLVDAQGASCRTLQGEGIDALLGGGRECSLRRGKCAGRAGGSASSGGVSNAWETGSTSSSDGGASAGRSRRGRGGRGGGSHSRSSSGVGGLPYRAERGAEAGVGIFVGNTAGPAHALDPHFFPTSPLNLRGKGKEAGMFSSSLIQAARGGLEVQRLDASDPASGDPTRGTGIRIDSSRAAAAPVGEGLLQAAGESHERVGGTCLHNSWDDVSSSEGPSYQRAGLGSAGARRLSLGGVASGAMKGAATAAEITLLPVPPAITPRGCNGFPDGREAWHGDGEAGGTGPGPGRQQQRRRWGQQKQRRRRRWGGEGSGGKAMTASTNGWTSSSSSSGSSSSSDPGSSDDDFPGSGGGGGGLLSGKLSATPSTRLSLGATSYASSGVGGGRGGGGNRVPSFSSSGFPIDGGASPPGDRQSVRSLDRRGLRSREVLPYFPMGGGAKSSTIASLTSGSSRSSSCSVSSGRRGSNVSGSGGGSGSGRSPCDRDREGRRGGGEGWGATFGNRWGSGEPSREKGAMTTAPYNAAAAGGRVRSGGGGGNGDGGGDWGVEFSGDPGIGAGEGATRLRRREGWIV